MRLASHRLKLAVAPLAPAKSGAPSVPESENRLQTCAYRCAFQRVSHRTEIEYLRFHDLRHEAATHLFERGFNIMEVTSLTDHKDLRADGNLNCGHDSDNRAD